MRHRVHRQLAGLVAGMVGHRERSDTAIIRRQPAGSLMPLVFSFGDSLEVYGVEGGGRAFQSFVAGFMCGPATTQFTGTQECIQVYLTPVGVLRLLGVPGSELANRVTELADLLPTVSTSTTDQLHAASTWAERFRLVEDLLIRRAQNGRREDDFVNWMWHRIVATDARVPIADLVSATGWSHRHVTARFTNQIGLGPKAAASVVRFERAAADLGSAPLAELAHRHGYADQSHLSRDFMRYTGETPTAHADAARPTAYTALGRDPGQIS